MTIPEQLTEYIEEANINFMNSRFKDSANTFSMIAKSCRRNNFIQDTIYFTYRSIIAHDRDNNNRAILSLMADLGIYLLKQSAKLSSDLINETEDLKDRLSVMRRAENILSHLKMNEDREIVVESIIMLSEQLIDESSEEEALQFLEIIREYSDDSKYLIKSIEIYESIADNYLCHKYPNDKILNDKEENEFKKHYYTKAFKIACFNEFEDLCERIKLKISKLKT